MGTSNTDNSQPCFHHDTYCVSRYNNKETIHTERACDFEENMRVLRFQFWKKRQVHR